MESEKNQGGEYKILKICPKPVIVEKIKQKNTRLVSAKITSEARYIFCNFNE